ncbi:MAG: trypsin-like peptidase domain-containing protein, partial [Bacteroidota bacterium]
SQAKVIGTDAATDIAVLKVNEKDLPYMEFGNSDDVKLGQWVLAVGYPLTLDATVTAGIVSAKSRSIGIHKSQTGAIESYIQTDAAVNPGNSGGALVNTNGQLIGINSAIASPTGSYAGYSYAIPANIVHKVVNDLMQYGSFQRAYMGIEYIDLKNASADDLKELKINRKDGVYVANIVPEGGAAKAGIKKGDFITQINGVPITSEPELQEQVARYKPGDNVSVTYLRSGSQMMATVELKNINGNTTIIKENTSTKLLGASFKSLNNDEKRKFNVRGGVKVTELGTGILSQQTNMRKDFVITHINDVAVSTVEDLQKVILSAGAAVQIAGFYPGRNGIYYYGINNVNAGDGSEQ